MSVRRNKWNEGRIGMGRRSRVRREMKRERDEEPELPSDRAMHEAWERAQRRDESAGEEEDAAGWDGSML